MGLPPMMMNILLLLVNVFVVYVAAFKFRLPWYGIVGVMALASVLMNLIVKLIGSSRTKKAREASVLLSDAIETLVVTIISTIAVLIVLSMKFGFPQAIGIAVLSGITIGFLRLLGF